MNLHLKGKTVLVTGAAGGVGLACVCGYIAEGANVVATDISPGAENAVRQTVAAKFAGADAQLLYRQADMRDAEAISDLVTYAEDHFGVIEICVNNAAITHRVDFVDMELADFDRVIATNLRGPFILGQAIARRLITHKRPGVIVNIGSVNAQLALPDNAAYVSSKGGLLQLTKSMAIALAHNDIRVTMVAPGSIDTPLQQRGMSRSPELRHRVLSRTPLGRLGRPEEVADAIIYMSSNRASYITGECLFVDGGRLPLNFTVPVNEGTSEI